MIFYMIYIINIFYFNFLINILSTLINKIFKLKKTVQIVTKLNTRQLVMLIECARVFCVHNV